MKALRSLLIVASAITISLCAGCQTYAPLTLDEHPHLATELGALKIPGPASGLKSDAVDISKPLTVDAVALLAVTNNPDLVAGRANRGIAAAQIVQAGLLPNPQITGSYAFLRAGPATTDAWTAGLAEDIRALVTFSSVKRGAELGAAQIEADLLWEEWQVIGKARLLYLDRVKQGELRKVLAEARALLADRYARDRKAVDEGNLTLAGVAPDLAALADIDKQSADAELKAQTGARDLNLLLGLDPSVRLDLDHRIEIPRIDPKEIEAILPDLAKRRPDLVALQLGYASQEEKLWGAILAQFPALVLGGSGGRDTSAVYSIGPTITMDLPIFNRNQGNIAIEKATRAKLRIEFSNRLNNDTAEIHGLLADQVLLTRQLATARDAAAEADRAARAAESAYASTLIDARSNADLVNAALARKQEVIAMEQLLLEQQAALATLTGIDMPITDPLPDTAGVSE